jgi:hypothetical protein
MVLFVNRDLAVQLVELLRVHAHVAQVKMEQFRKEQLSIYYWLKDSLPEFVTVTTEFPQDELVLPSVSVISLPTKAVPFQLGGRDLDKRDWAIYVFGKNSGQRDDYGSLIYRTIEDGICVYNYDVGFPPATTPPQIGSLYVESREYKPLRVYEDLVKKQYWWGVVTIRTYFNPT